eukprot:Skav235248  [mRNA]  locus=scaffold3995:334813:335572:+ [translate_table: standard]
MQQNEDVKFMCSMQRLRIDDVVVGPDCVCGAAPLAVQEAIQASNGTEAAGQQRWPFRAAAIVGCYMALREADIDLLPDDELLMGCRRISSEHPSTVLEKFIGFLEDALEDEDSEDDE